MLDTTSDASEGLRLNLKPADPITTYRSTYRDLVRLATAFVGDLESAEDLVQDTFLRVHDKWPRIRDADASIRYLRTAVVNAARDVLRRRRRARKLPWTGQPHVPGADVEVLGNLRGAGVRDAVAGLPRRQREVITLRYLSDLSITETALTLGISPAAVKTSAGRALATLSTTLGEHHHA